MTIVHRSACHLLYASTLEFILVHSKILCNILCTVTRPIVEFRTYKLFQPVHSDNSLRIFGRFRYCEVFQMADVPKNQKIPEFSHAFPMVAEFSGRFTSPESANSEVCTFISDDCGRFPPRYILLNWQIPAIYQCIYSVFWHFWSEVQSQWISK
jgi:hypothetical protein